MLKVSFKDKAGCPARKVEVFNDKATIVTLTGVVKAPEWWWKIPKEIHKWMTNHPSVEVYDNLLGNVIVKVIGKSICSDEDEFNPVLGERIAEARAKKKLYGFMLTLTKKLICYYHNLLYGKFAVKVEGETADSCIYKEMEKYSVLYGAELEHLRNLLAIS